MSDIETIKEKLDIVSVISNYAELKNAGSNYKANCPFHQEKTPSFMVNPSLQIYKCFGCGKGGDVITFIKDIERLEFPDALRKAAEMAGVELTGNFSKDKKKEEKKAKIHEANMLTAKYYHHIFKTHKLGKEAREYAQKRGIEAEQVTKFMFGYAPNNYENLKNFLISRKFNEAELLEFGLIVERKNKTIDKFRDRLMQPIFDLSGNVVGFSGRYLGTYEGAPKYLNSSESLVYKKNETLYSLYHSKEDIIKNNFVIITEGNIDVVSGHKAGTPNILAPLGTAFTANQAKLIKRFTSNIYFCFDNDKAGLSALVRSIEIVENLGFEHKVIDLGEYKDTDDLIQADIKLWQEKIQSAVPTIDYLIDKFSKDLDLGSLEGKTEFRNKILPVLKSLKDEIKISHYIQKVSLMIEISQEALRSEVNKGQRLQKSDSGPVEETEIRNQKTESEQEITNERDLNLEKYLLALITQSGNHVNIKINKKVFAHEKSRKLFEVLSELQDRVNEIDLKNLDSEVEELYKEINLIDLESIGDKPKEIEKVYARLYEIHLKSEILRLRSKLDNLNDDAAEKVINEIAELTKKLKA
jgi:DNA primase